jgi:hypothetical protein
VPYVTTDEGTVFYTGAHAAQLDSAQSGSTADTRERIVVSGRTHIGKEGFEPIAANGKTIQGPMPIRVNESGDLEIWWSASYRGGGEGPVAQDVERERLALAHGNAGLDRRRSGRGGAVASDSDSGRRCPRQHLSPIKLEASHVRVLSGSCRSALGRRLFPEP